MKFQIKVSYTTGDSYGTENTYDILDYEWENEKVAIENAEAIIQHYNAYQQENDGRWVVKYDQDYMKKWWYDEPTRLESGWPNIDASMLIKLDDGTLVRYHCPWCGYFEHLNEVEIVIKAMKYYPN